MTTYAMRLALAAGALSLAVAGAVAAGPAEPTVAEPVTTNTPPGTVDNFDVYYNVCRGTDPRCYRPWVSDRENKVLIYSRTAGPRHANINPALGPGLDPPLSATGNVAQRGLKAWLEAVGVEVHWTEDVNTLASQLGPGSEYKAVIFLSNSRDALWKHGTAVNPARAVDTSTGAYLDAGKVALRQYIRSGGGFVGIHNAFGTEYNWPWYEGLLGNANYYNHGRFQDGDIETVAKSDSSTNGLPARWAFRDEWYNLEPFPTNVKFLLTVDETSLATLSNEHPGHGSFHPIAWCQYYDGGRSWVTTLGHDAQAFTDGSGFPSQALFKQFIVNGILSAMGNVPFCTN
ncbi:MAG TPA: ThuA domain-containing protein [Casimicrobiaceae bacterium]|nr:ThuA domain-containing protein [Casimicrobiaceae bacterium]